MASLTGGMGFLLAAVDRDEVRRTAEEVFSDRAYERNLSLWERLTRWLAERLGDRAPSLGGGGAASAGASSVLLYLFLAGLLVVVVVLVVLAVRHRPARRGRSEEGPLVAVDDLRSADEWRREAERAEAEGRWKDALRAWLAELVAVLTDRGVLDRVPGRTTGEFRGEILRRSPSASEAFDRAATSFEEVWYGDQPCGPDEVAALRFAAAEVRALATSPVVEGGLGHEGVDHLGDGDGDGTGDGTGDGGPRGMVATVGGPP